MSMTHFIDTSILLNLLEVPDRCDDAPQIKQEFKQLVDKRDWLILPIASIVETGNHIAHISDGNRRRDRAERFSRFISYALEGKEQWQIGAILDDNILRDMKDGFLDAASQGVGLGDLSLIKAYEAYVARDPHIETRIWSLDKHLSGYSHRPPAIGQQPTNRRRRR